MNGFLCVVCGTVGAKAVNCSVTVGAYPVYQLAADVCADHQDEGILNALEQVVQHARRVVMVLAETGDRPPPVPWCEPDDCPASICNGPHVSHTCPNGDVVTKRAGDPSPCPFCGATETGDRPPPQEADGGRRGD